MVDEEVEVGEETGGGGLAGGGTDHELIGAVLQGQDFDGAGFRVDEPVFFDAVLFVKVAFFDAVTGASAKGNDFGNEVGGAHDDAVDDVEAVFGNESDVGLGDVVFGEDHVEGGGDDFPKAARDDPVIQ